MLDLSTAPEQRPDGIIPDGTFVRVKASLRDGGASLPNMEPLDNGLFKCAKPPSDAVMLDWEFTVLQGQHARRKFWQLMTVAGGSLDEKGISKAWNITKASLRAMIDSALGLDPKDESDAAKQKRVLRGFRDLDGIEFVCKVGIERGTEGYADKNRIAHVVTPNEPEYAVVMRGEEPPPKPTGASGGSRSAAPAAVRPAWGGGTAAPAAQPAWGGNSVSAPATAAPATAPTGGPAWLHG